jgi:biopolymer transport protein TolQ
MILIASNPFISSYAESDWFGKGIFLGLFILSAVCWTLVIYKSWQFWAVGKLSEQFSEQFAEKKDDPLNLHFQRPTLSRIGELPHPLFDIYRTVKQQTLLLISRNQDTGLSEADMQLIESGVFAAISLSSKKLEKHLFILPMIVTLAPFLGLLGTVWGILLTFAQLQAGAHAGNAAMLSGLSMALATTVLGLLVAIPALIGYSYLKNSSKETRRDMEGFSYCLLSAIEMQHRRE